MQLTDIPNGLTYAAYKATWQQRLSQGMKGLDVSERKRLMHRKYNMERSNHVEKNLALSAETRETMAKLPRQFLVVITEDWCLDSAFHLPVIAAMANENSAIELRILERDAHSDIIDNYLTNGGRAIPKLVIFNEKGGEVATWGPRSEAAKAFRQNLVEQGFDKNEVAKGLLDFYTNFGWEHTERELGNLVSAAV